MLAVVAYHMEIPVSGGFLGVDVFFVISGFVITRMIFSEFWVRQEFRLRTFFVRRAARLFPALATLLLVVLFLSHLLIGPASFPQQTTLTAFFGAFGLSNFWIGLTHGNYFGSDPESNSLLNLWSLAVEEQFYFVYAPILALIFLISKAHSSPWRAINIAIFVVLAASLLSFSLPFFEPAIPENIESVTIGFFSPLSRIWEFGIGIMVYFLGLKVNPGPKTADLLVLVGLGLILTSFFIVNWSDNTPGITTLCPAMGAGAYLFGGGQARFSKWFTSNKVLEWVGDRSYSIYLWHWPLLYFSFILDPARIVGPIFAAALTIIAGAVSYRWIETPFRIPGDVVPRKYALGAPLGFMSAVLASLLCVPALGNAVTFASAVAGHKTALEGEIGNEEYFNLIDKEFYPCASELKLELAPVRFDVVRCHQSIPDAPPTHILFGGSHAEHLFPGLAEAMPLTNWAYFVTGGIDVMSGEAAKRYREIVVDSESIQTVVISAWWWRKNHEIRHLPELVKDFESAGKTVFVTNDIPTFEFDASVCKYSKTVFPWPPRICEGPVKESAFLPSLRELKEKGITVIDTYSVFCRGEVCSMLTVDGELAYRDSNHLSRIGSAWVASEIVIEVSRQKASPENLDTQMAIELKIQGP